MREQFPKQKDQNLQLTTSINLRNLTPAINVNSKSVSRFTLIFKAFCTFLFHPVVNYIEKDSLGS